MNGKIVKYRKYKSSGSGSVLIPIAVAETLNWKDKDELFLSFEDIKKDIIIGFLRLRIPSKDVKRKEISSTTTSLVRELHVFGPMQKIGEKSDTGWQHKGYGLQLLEEAEKVSMNDYDRKKILVISGIGAREYYYKFGYKKDGPFVSKILN